MLTLKHASLLHWMEKLKETAKGRRYDTQLFSISMRKNWPIKFANCSRYIKVDICFRACIPINLFLKIISEFSLFSDNKPSKRLSTTNQVWKNHCYLSNSHLPAVKKKLLGCRCYFVRNYAHTLSLLPLVLYTRHLISFFSTV